jgi:Zn-dependent oligopeptidase
MDFVEGPSEFLGRWGLRPAVVARYARHHETGEPIPAELIEALVRTENLNAATDLSWTLLGAKVDALLHGEAEIAIDAAVRTAWAETRGTRMVEATSFAAGFSHMVGGGYDAATYGYVWSQIIRDDLLEHWEEEGLLSAETGARYRRTVLEATFLDDPVAAVNAFLGRHWSAEAFMRRAGQA